MGLLEVAVGELVPGVGLRGLLLVDSQIPLPALLETVKTDEVDDLLLAYLLPPAPVLDQGPP
jgi:hypothetical protein